MISKKLSGSRNADSEFYYSENEAEPRLPDNLPFIAWRATKLSVFQSTSPTKEGHPARILLIRIILRHDIRQFGMLEIVLEWALSSLRNPPVFSPNLSRHAEEYVYIGLLSFITGLVASAETSVIAPFLVRKFEIPFTSSYQSLHRRTCLKSRLSNNVL